MIEIYGVFILHILGFFIAYIFHTDKITDLFYALGFIILAVGSYIRTDSYLLLLLITLWGIRLGGFLAFRVLISGKDSRFDEIRKSPFKYGGFWLVQAVLIIVISTPVLLSTSHISYFGIIIGLFGLVYETIADYQKFVWKYIARQKSFIQTGLWKYSQHPNYLGEILVWIGVCVAVLPGLSISFRLISLVGPAAIIGILVYGSGIPIARKRNLAKYGNSYKKYMKETSVLIPWFK